MRLLMTRVKDARGDAEKELMQALADTSPVNNPHEICPSSGILRSFFDGSIANESILQQILAHLAGCRSCLQKMRAFRKRRLHLKWTAAVSAAVLIITASTFLLSPRQKAQSTDSQIATLIDLNQPIKKLGAGWPSSNHPRLRFGFATRRRAP